MVRRKLALLAFLLPGLTVTHTFAAGGVVVVSDEYTDMNRPVWEDGDSSGGVIPAQFQSRSRAGNAGSSRTSTRQAGLAGDSQRNVQISQLRLANTPKMMGDFFGLPGQTAVVGELFSKNGPSGGLAVHQTIDSGSVFANDNIALITTDAGTMKTVFLGGPGGITPGTFFEPSISPNQIQNPQTGLRLDGDSVNFYTAVLNGDLTNVFDNPANSTPSISDAPVYQVFQVTEIHVPGPNVGDTVGRVRVQDNNSAMPQDRVFLDYNYFHNVPFTANGIDVNRFTPGAEKTFWDGMGSLEVRVPMGVTFSSNQFLAADPDTSQSEFGNIALISKFLLTSSEQCAVAAGLAVALPTADDYEVFGSTGTPILTVENNSVHLIPYLALLYTPTRGNCFVQSFVTVDADTNGNPVLGDVGAGNLEEIGTWNDQTLVSASGAFGKYVYQNDSRNSCVQTVALVSEFHYTATVNDGDVVNAGPFLLGNEAQDLSLLNATFGGNVRFRNCSVTSGYTVPLTSSDRIFDGELRMFINRFF